MKHINSNAVWIAGCALFIACCVWFSWWRYNRLHPPYSPEVNAALQLAGSNRGELEKALKHYAAGPDTLKLRAAEFLIVNMPGKYRNITTHPGTTSPRRQCAGAAHSINKR